MFLAEQVYKPLLSVSNRAMGVSRTAIVVYYTKNPYHLSRLEDEIVGLQRDLEGLRLALEAPRSRGADPLELVA